MGVMKSLMHNINRPDRSIPEGYITIECVIFYSRYLVDTETKFNRGINNGNNVSVDDSTSVLGIFHSMGRPLGGAKTRELSNGE